MAVNTTTIAARLAETLIVDLVADSSNGEENIFSGTTLANKLYEVELDNSQNGLPAYLKIQFATSFNANNAPNLQFYAPAGDKACYTFPDGLPFTTGISFVGSTTGAATGAQTDPIEPLKVKLLGGT
tara:strand:+ start:13917 stop:14297 length:381 start_codon:yes stop_codon:yes gene_type:complete